MTPRTRTTAAMIGALHGIWLGAFAFALLGVVVMGILGESEAIEDAAEAADGRSMIAAACCGAVLVVLSHVLLIPGAMLQGGILGGVIGLWVGAMSINAPVHTNHGLVAWRMVHGALAAVGLASIIVAICRAPADSLLECGPLGLIAAAIGAILGALIGKQVCTERTAPKTIRLFNP